MSKNNALPLLLGGVVVVALSFGMGYLGGSIAGPAAEPGEVLPAAGGDTGAVQDRLAEYDRRLRNMEGEIRIAKESAIAAMNKASALETRVHRLELGGTAPAAAPVEPTTEEPDPVAKTIEEEIDAFKVQIGKTYADTAREALKTRIRIIGDASEQGAKDRFTQARTEAQQFAVAFNVTGDRADQVEQIFHDEMDAAARQVGPYVREGLANADLASVRSGLASVWAETDRRVMGLLDEDDRKRYEREIKPKRKVVDKILEDLQNKR